MQPDPKQVPERGAGESGSPLPEKHITPNALRDAAAEAARLAAPVFKAAGYKWEERTPDVATIAATLAPLAERASKMECGSSGTGRFQVHHWFEDGWEQYSITLEMASVIGEARADIVSTQPQPESGSEWKYDAIRMGRRWYAKRFIPGGPVEFWESREWHPYSIAAFQERERAAGLLGKRPESGSGEEGDEAQPEEGVCPECDHDIRPHAWHARGCSRHPFNQPPPPTPTQPLQESELERLQEVELERRAQAERAERLQTKLQRVEEEKDEKERAISQWRNKAKNAEGRSCDYAARATQAEARIDQAAKEVEGFQQEAEANEVPCAVASYKRVLSFLRSQSSSEVGEAEFTVNAPELPLSEDDQREIERLVRAAYKRMRDGDDRDECGRPPAGWRCTREPGHDGPCAASPSFGCPDCKQEDLAGRRERAVDELLEIAKLAHDDAMREELEQLASRLSLPPSSSEVEEGTVRVFACDQTYESAFSEISHLIHAANPGQSLVIELHHIDRDGKYFTVTTKPYETEVQAASPSTPRDEEESK
jgi:hypothetical protein